MPPQPRDTHWHYSKNGAEIGPVTYEQLKAMADNGQLGPDDLIWKSGMRDWKRAGSLKGLFAEPSNKGSRPPTPSDRAQKLFNRAGEIARKVGRIASDAVDPAGFDEYSKITGGADQPGIFLQSEFFGGRTKIGASMESLNTLGGRIGVVAFSWIYVLPFLRSLPSGWEFLPFSRTEFVRITLEQKIMWRRISPAFVTWMITILVFCIVAVIASVFAATIQQYLGATLGAFAFLLVPMIMFGGYLIANAMVLQHLMSLSDDDLHRSQITLEYGFPRKYRLLSGMSDAPIANQIDGVLKLCEAISRTEFSQWDQFSNHGSDGGLLSSLFHRFSRMV